MAENSKIEWTDHTINFWWGCTKVSPACANCYAERQDLHFHPSPRWQDRFQGEKATASHWGATAPRLLRVDAARIEALRYECRAVKEGRRFRVFTNSMSDFFEDRRDLDGARLKALDTIRQTPQLDWLILTKRPEKILDLLALAQKMEQENAITPRLAENALTEWLGWWLSGKAPANVWLGTTVEDQERADHRIPALLQVPATVRFLSCEPLLGKVDLERIVLKSSDHPEVGKPDVTIDALRGWFGGAGDGRTSIDWVICGGESGPHARPMHPDWIRGLRDQCIATGVPFFFKQWGEYEDTGDHGPWRGDVALWPDGNGVVLRGAQFPTSREATIMRRVGKTRAGRLLDGMEHNGMPEVH